MEIGKRHPKGAFIAPPQAVHTYECRYWHRGKSQGPCTCGALELQAEIDAELAKPQASGFSFHFAADGLWLNAESPDGRKASINLSTFRDGSRLIAPTIRAAAEAALATTR